MSGLKDIIECSTHSGQFWLAGLGCCVKCGATTGGVVGAASAQDLRRPPLPSQPRGATAVEATLAERGARYGDFTDHAQIAEALHGILVGDTPAGKFNTSWGTMKPFQRQALRVIVDKIARILNGDPDYVDNWHDLQGYAKLVEDRLAK